MHKNISNKSFKYIYTDCALYSSSTTLYLPNFYSLRSFCKYSLPVSHRPSSLPVLFTTSRTTNFSKGIFRQFRGRWGLPVMTGKVLSWTEHGSQSRWSITALVCWLNSFSIVWQVASKCFPQGFARKRFVDERMLSLSIMYSSRLSFWSPFVSYLWNWLRKYISSGSPLAVVQAMNRRRSIHRNLSIAITIGGRRSIDRMMIFSFLFRF